MPLKTIFIACIGTLLLFNVCLSQEDIPFLGEVDADNINIRTDSTAGSSIICVVNKGERLEVISLAYDWYKVRLPEAAPAYIKKDLLECVALAKEDGQTLGMRPVALAKEDGQTLGMRPFEYSKEMRNAGRSAKVSKEIVNVRLGASQSFPIIGKVKKADIVNILGEKGDWCKVKPASNCFGWINKKFVRKAILPQKIQPQKEIIKAQEKKAQDNDIVIIEGQVLPKTIKRLATHKIVDKDKRLYLLKSDKVDLNFFNRQKVKIIGRLIDRAKRGISKNAVISVEKIEVMD